MSELTREDLVELKQDLRGYMTERFDSIDRRLDDQNGRLRATESSIAALGPDVARAHARIHHVEDKTEEHDGCLKVLKDRSARPGLSGAAGGGGAGLLIVMAWEFLKRKLFEE